MTRQEFLTKKIEFFIDDYRKRRDEVRHKAHASKLAVVLLGAATTVVVGLREFAILVNYGEWLGILALFLSAGATTVAAWEGFANYSWRWVHSRHFMVRFLQIKDEITFHSTDPDGLSDDALEEYFDRMMSVVENANAQWSDKRGAAIDG